MSSHVGPVLVKLERYSDIRTSGVNNSLSCSTSLVSAVVIAVIDQKMADTHSFALQSPALHSHCITCLLLCFLFID